MDNDGLNAGVPRSLMRRFIVPTGTLDPLLSRLILSVSAGELPTLPHFARPLSGCLRDVSIDDEPRARLLLEHSGSLMLFGTSETVYGRLTESEKRTATQRLQKGDAHLLLEDGSQLYADLAQTTGYQAHYGETASPFEWRASLGEWRWWKSSAIRYWVGVIDGYKPPQTQNLAVQGLKAAGWTGLHIPRPDESSLQESVTLIEREHKEQLVIIIQHLPPKDDDDFEQAFRRLRQVNIILKSVLAIGRPSFLFGYDDRLQVTAVLAYEAISDRINTVLPLEAPPGGIFVPATRMDWVRHKGDVWLVPFLQQLLRPATVSRASVYSSLCWFADVLGQDLVEQQLVGLGTAIRIVLYEEGMLRQDSYLDPKQVDEALTRFGSSRKTCFPPGAQEALAMAHRMALLGPSGISSSRLDTRDAYHQGTLSENISILRATFASLIAAVVQYTGPLFLDLSPDRSQSIEYHPCHQVDKSLGDAQAAMASFTYLAENSDVAGGK